MQRTSRLKPRDHPRPRLALANAAVLLMFITGCGEAANTADPAPIRMAQVAPQFVAASADQKPLPSGTVERDCYLAVDGTAAVDGPCLVFPMGDDGSYTLNTWSRGKPRNSHFAVVSTLADGTVQATWNADPDEDRALGPLGAVHRESGCWVNRRTRICAREQKAG